MNQKNTAKSAPANRSSIGPFDIDEIESLAEHADFGAIKFRAQSDVQVRLEIEEQTSRVTAMQFEVADSTLQVQAFAAPKTDGLWHEVRAQLMEAITTQGGEVEERLGSFGPELVAKLPLTDDKGARVGDRFARFIGVDGPRWFLRGMIGGAAINDPAAASLVEVLFRSLVVERGNEPVPPRDLLTLHFPEGVVVPPRNALS